MIYMNIDQDVKLIRLHYCKKYYICDNSVESNVNQEENLKTFKETKEIGYRMHKFLVLKKKNEMTHLHQCIQMII